MNLVPESLDFQTSNDQTYATSDKRNEVWSEYLKEKDAAEKAGRPPPPHPKDPFDPSKTMTRKPREVAKKNLKQLLAMCKCSISSCVMRNSDTGSTCFNKCRYVDAQVCVPADAVQVDARYPWNGNGCTCPICKCQCNKMYAVDDF